MLGTFLGLEIAKQGLQAQQAAIEIAGHNIDNANTPGYTRERADLVASLPLDNMPGQVGTGVRVQQIQRLRDDYLDGQYRDQNQLLGEWQAKQDSLQKISAIINEPSDSGLSTVMQNFWNAWDQLAANSSDLSARNSLVQNAVTVAQTINQTANQLSDLNADLTTSLNDTVKQVNSYLTQIAQLNKGIDSVQQSGEQPNDLLDQRDYLVDQLSSLVDVSVQSDSTTPFQLSIGGTVVLNDQTVISDPSDPTQPLLHTTGDAANPLSISVNGGQIKGLVDSLSSLQGYQADLDTFAGSLADGPMTVSLAGSWTIYPSAPDGTAVLPVDITINGHAYTAGTALSDVESDNPTLNITTDPATGAVTIPQGTQVTVNGLNALLQMGYDQNGAQGEALFTLSSTDPAASITVNPDILNNVSKLAASFSTNAGDGTLAMTVSSVKSAQVQFSDPADSTAPMPLTTGTLDSFLQAVVGQLGIQGQQANQQVSNQQALVQQIDTQRQSVAGVSIDEEMSNIIQYQQAYNASAKVVSTINDLLNTLIENV
ncbi:hypothetical protein GCM10025857_26580 [Alicyclobacillus contaminans]|uniref:flagellar hook-associated protein FlgK n=1 Tax=Alicyclobacillus contaminans TaxID=392016 RepID=UPI00041C7144|nr:flagellar hook-associated protein FlgK [Alicyclobacillus contaminans]GMA51301.1 hypothetical protein GCM10025857_26580 [Alicyclobacillus contaminans]